MLSTVSSTIFRNLKSFFDQDTIKILKLAITLKITLLLFIYFFHTLIPFNQLAQKSNFFYKPASTEIGKLLSPWDGQWYLFLSEKGYRQTPTGVPNNMHFAFAPLYPMLVRYFSIITFRNYELSSLLVNIVVGAIGIILFYKLTRLDYSRKISNLSVLFFLINPMAIFYLAFYSEVLFFTLICITFYLSRKSKWLYAGAFGALGSATRIQGILLMIPLGIEAFTQYKSVYKRSLSTKLNFHLPRIFGLLMIPIGMFFFLFISYLITKNPLTMFSSQQYFSREETSIMLIPKTILKNVTSFRSLPVHGFSKSKIDTITIFVCIVIIIYMYKIKIRPSYIALSILFLAVPLATGSTMSIIRIISTSFPLYLSLGFFGSKNQNRTYSITIISTSLMIMFSMLFVNWYWVA